MKLPTYGNQTTKKREYCAKHALDGMVNVVNKLCENPACTKIPTYGVAGTKITRFCVQHAEAGMVDVLNRCAGLSNVHHPGVRVGVGCLSCVIHLQPGS